MSTFKERLETFALRHNALGCSRDEIESLVQQFRGKLPHSYLHFMEVAGNGIDDFLKGSDFTLKDLEGVREAADDLLREAGLEPLSPDAFVFVMHQGYQFYFFHDGCVYYFQEGADHIEKRFDSFEQFFDSVVNRLT